VTTTKEMIADWFDMGIIDQAFALGTDRTLGEPLALEGPRGKMLTGVVGYMLIVCDTFSYEDYPVYTTAVPEEFWPVYDKYNGRNMQQIMECYVLDQSKRDAQLNNPGRTLNVPAASSNGITPEVNPLNTGWIDKIADEIIDAAKKADDKELGEIQERLLAIIQKQDRQIASMKKDTLVTPDRNATPVKSEHGIKLGKWLVIECPQTGRKTRTKTTTIGTWNGAGTEFMFNCPSCGEELRAKRKPSGFMDGYQTYDASEERGNADAWKGTFKQVVKGGVSEKIRPVTDEPTAKPKRRIRFEDES